MNTKEAMEIAAEIQRRDKIIKPIVSQVIGELSTMWSPMGLIGVSRTLVDGTEIMYNGKTSLEVFAEVYNLIEKALGFVPEKKNPIRVVRSRAKGWKNPENTVYVGRGSKWGNPFKVEATPKSIGKYLLTFSETYINDESVKKIYSENNYLFDTKEEAVERAIQCYGAWLLPYTHQAGGMERFYLSDMNLKSIKEELAGKNLSCWCKAGDMCHADWLLQIANE